MEPIEISDWNANEQPIDVEAVCENCGFTWPKRYKLPCCPECLYTTEHMKLPDEYVDIKPTKAPEFIFIDLNL